jgi:RNA polymerase sigma-70 factor (ECF subfamily)
VKAKVTHFTGGDADLADDITQETWIRVATRLTSFRGRGYLRAWILRVCSRICIDHSRREAVRRRREEEWSVADLRVMTGIVAIDDGEPLGLSVGDSDRVANAVVALPPRRRAMVIAEVWFSKTPRQIAEIFNTTPARVWKELSVARAQLRVQLRRFRLRSS